MILLSVIFVQSYKQWTHSIDDQIVNQMKICSFDLECKGLDIDFVPQSKEIQRQKLYKQGDVYSYFSVPTVDGYLLKVLLTKSKYLARIKSLKNELVKEFLFYGLLIAMLSFVFSLYALRPLKKALEINEEFVRDILHDINTPLSALMINFKLFKKQIGENRKIERMQSSVDTIVSLQNNLRSFLEESQLQKEDFSLEQLLKERIRYHQSLYSNISFITDLKNVTMSCNKDAFTRIIDNLLDNACKYNKHEGKVEINYCGTILNISDTGVGIKNVKKVFERFYKESQRGVGIGMHIVKKLCDAMGIEIVVISQLKKGTVVSLDLKAVILK